MSENSSKTETSRGKTHADVAHLLRAIERGIIYDRLPAPRGLYVDPTYAYAKLTFDTPEDVHAWAPLAGATIVTAQHVYDRDTDRPWHEVGTEWGGKQGQLGGWKVSMWASVRGLPPEPEHSHVGGTIGGPGENEVECACGVVFSGFDSQAEALAALNAHIANPADAQAGV